MTTTHRRILITGIVLMLMALAAAGGWFAAARVQKDRADAHLEEAMGRIVRANDLLSGLQLEKLEATGFTSLDNINASAAVAQTAGAGLEAAHQETDAAAAAVGIARRLAFLPSWYREYLSKKEEITGLRSQQLDVLSEKVDTLNQFYAAGPLIYTAIQDRDRLMGEFQTAYGMIKDDPRGAAASLAGIEQGLQSVQEQLSAAYQQKRFSLLYDMASSTDRYIALTQIAMSLAEAATAGDQARIQDLSASLQIKLEEANPGIGLVDSWWQDRITPLERQYRDLQTSQEDLDAQAAAIYDRESR